MSFGPLEIYAVSAIVTTYFLFFGIRDTSFMWSMSSIWTLFLFARCILYVVATQTIFASLFYFRLTLFICANCTSLWMKVSHTQIIAQLCTFMELQVWHPRWPCCSSSQMPSSTSILVVYMSFTVNVSDSGRLTIIIKNFNANLLLRMRWMDYMHAKW